MNYRSTTFLTQGRVGYKEVPKMAETIALAILGAGAAGTTAATVLTFAVGVGISVAVSWAISALTPQPRAPSRRLMANLREAAGAQEYVYGRVRKGGVVTYVASSGGSSDERNLYQTIVLAGHEVEEIGDLYVNDGKVTLDSDGFVQQRRWWEGGKPRIRIRKFDGTQTSRPPFPGLPSNFIGRGIAYLSVQLIATNGNTWRNGIPLVTAEVKGKKVFDPRTNTTAWSDNAALCIRDYLVDERGMDDAGNIDEVTFSAAADVCDTRDYQINGVVNSENPTGNILQDMMTSCAGTLFWGGGKWRLKAGDYTFPIKTFTLDDLRSGISIQTRNSMRDSFNVVQGLFNDAEQRWIEASYQEYFEQEFLEEDKNVRTPLNFNLPLVTDRQQARFLAALTLRRSREQITFSADFGISALEVEPGDIVNLNMDRYGWSDKEFEVIDWRLAPNSEGGDLRVSLTLREVSEAAFDPTIPAVEITSNNSELPTIFPQNAPGTPVIEEELYATRDGLGARVLLNISWEPPEDEEITRYRVFARRVSDIDGTPIDSDFQAYPDVSSTFFQILDVKPGTWEVFVVGVNDLNIETPESEITTRTVFGLTAEPQVLEGVSLQSAGGLAVIKWQRSRDLDVRLGGNVVIRHTDALTPTWQNSYSMDIVDGNEAIAVVPLKPGKYLIRAQDSGGRFGPVSMVSTKGIQAVEFSPVDFLQADAAFSGLKENLAVVDDTLRLNGALNIDDWGDIDDVMNFDFNGGIESQGIYTFATAIDLGSVRRVRLRSEIELNAINVLSTVDERLGNIDQWLDFDETEGAEVDCIVEYRQSDDDPSGTPDFTEFSRLDNTEVEARVIEARAIVTTGDPSFNASVSKLRVYADEVA